jgi:hypothetical protein
MECYGSADGQSMFYCRGGGDSGRNEATVEATVDGYDGVAWRVSQLTTTTGATTNLHPSCEHATC